jgi:ABC-2 type transport system ATP-binding protein
MSATPVFQFENVSKHYPTDWLGRRSLTALVGVSLRLQPGEVLALLGPNRAGKTTLVKILLSLCRPSSGSVLRFGSPASNRASLGRIGYMHESQAFPRYHTASGLLRYYGALACISEPAIQRRIPKLLDLVGLSDRQGEPIARFSKGMVQRLGLAQALLNEPDLLVLDEPAEGLDLAGRQLLVDVITEQRRQGKSVLWITHQTAEAGQLCDRLAVLVQGRLVFEGAVGDLPRGNADPRDVSLEHALAAIYRRGAA